MLLLALLLSAASCDKSSSSSSSATTRPSSGSTVRIVYIPKNTGNPYFESIIRGFEEAAKELGDDFRTVAPATADPTSQLPLINDQVQQGVNVLAISPNSPDALNLALKDAMSRGVSIITVDCDLTGNEDCRSVGVFTVDPHAIAEGQIELMGSLIDYKGKLAILSATTDAPNQNQWIAIMKDTLAKNPKYKDMQLVEIVYGDDQAEKSTTETQALLTKYPDLRGIISPTTVGIAAAAQVVESARKADQVQVTGLGTPDQMRKFIKDGTVRAFLLWSPVDHGYLGGQIAHQIATGKLKPAPGVKFTAGRLGEHEFRDKNIVITGPPVTFTKENIDQYHF